MNISEKIFNIMDEKHLKQADLARKLNLKTGAVANWKVRGTTPPMEYAANICEFLGISLYESLGQDMKHFIQEQDIVLQSTHFIQIHFYLVIYLTMP